MTIYELPSKKIKFMRWTSFLLAIFASAEGKPEVTSVKFSSQPSKVIYFGNWGEAGYKVCWVEL